MRKRNCDKLFDNIMWYTIYLLPILMTLVMTRGIFTNFTFTDWQDFYEFGSSDYAFFDVLTLNLERLGFGANAGVFEPIVSIFESLGFMENAYSPLILSYFNYFVVVFMFHLFVDFILFIPRLAHKWLNTAYQGD